MRTKYTQLLKLINAPAETVKEHLIAWLDDAITDEDLELVSCAELLSSLNETL